MKKVMQATSVQPTMKSKFSVSIHWDYENISDTNLAENLIIFGQLRGDLVNKKAYAKRWKKFASAKNILKKHNFCLVDALLDIKNSADYRCMFDCIDAVKSDSPPDVFIFVAGDGDYAHVIRLLKCRGKQIIIFARHLSDSKKLKKLAHECYFIDDLPRLIMEGVNNS
ncbi:NYN domain-containing protein [Lyngbya aestuarii]|uniref:NYN domain-containing protein n=1 Tax=Lyngbya aestuarii TaxID=118322 RepID=UPI00403D60AC